MIELIDSFMYKYNHNKMGINNYDNYQISYLKKKKKLSYFVELIE
jgi:hypothetical protein